MYSAPSIIWVVKSRRVRWVGHVAHIGDSRGACRVLLGRPSRRWEVNIKMGLQEGRLRGMIWFYLTHDKDRWWALVNAVMKLWIP